MSTYVLILDPAAVVLMGLVQEVLDPLECYSERKHQVQQALSLSGINWLSISLVSLPFLIFNYPPSRLPSVPPEKIEMKDIKAEALYRRGPLGLAPVFLAAGMTFLLANINFVHYIARALLPEGGLTLFRLKFISAFHANANLKVMQSRLASDSLAPIETASILRDALNNSESKWLRKHSKLRNLLAHYSADRRLTASFSKDATRKQVIEHLSGGSAYEEVDVLLDRYLAKIANALETGFRLSGDPFWYGNVS